MAADPMVFRNPSNLVPPGVRVYYRMSDAHGLLFHLISSGSALAYNRNQQSMNHRQGSMVTMTHYRYFLLNRMRRASDSEEMECASDAEAVVIAEEILRRHPEFDCVELWSGTRRIHKIERNRI